MRLTAANCRVEKPALSQGLPPPAWCDEEYGVALYCGDCLEILPKLLKVDAVVTDPPYGMGFCSNYRNERHALLMGDDDTRLLHWICAVPVEHSRYVFCRWDSLAAVPPPQSCITWVKNNWSMGDLAHEHGRQTELILFYPGPLHVWPGPRPVDIIYSKRTGNSLHPTEKPVRLLEQIIKWTAGNVFDPFMGSGTTGVACVNLGRAFIGIEIEPRYFDIAVERIRKAIIAKQGGPLFAEHQPPEQSELFAGEST